MILYFAGANKSFLEKVDYKIPILTSYFYCNKYDLSEYDDIASLLFLDSGAYSAFTKNKEINIDEYIEFIHTFKDRFEVYAALDVIGDYNKTEENQKYMESCGLNPLPTFHYTEPFSVFKKMIDKYEYIAIGGSVGRKINKLIPFFDKCFRLICDKNGITNKKIHGFGLTKPYLMKRYPWYSVDSTSAILGAGMGNFLVNDKAVNLGRESIIPESIKKFIMDNYNFTLKELRDDYKLRIKLNVEYYTNLIKELTENPPRFIDKQLRLF